MPPSRGQLRPLLVAGGGGGGHRGETEHTLLNSGPGPRQRGAGRGAGGSREGGGEKQRDRKRRQPRGGGADWERQGAGVETGLRCRRRCLKQGCGPGRNVGLLEFPELEMFAGGGGRGGGVLRRGPLFSLQTAQSQSWFHITNPEPPAPAPPLLPLAQRPKFSPGKKG